MQQSAAQSSVMSKSVSTMDKTTIDIVKGNSSRLDKIFPFLDEIFKRTGIAESIVFIFTFYQIFQILAVTVWPGVSYLYHFSDAMTIFIKIALIDFSGMDNSSGIFVSFIIFTVIFVLCLVFFMVMAIYHHKTKKVIKWTLYVCRFILEFIPRILAIPLSSLVGVLFLKVINSPTTAEIVFFVITAIIFIIILIILNISQGLLSNSPYLSSSSLSAFHSGIHFYVVGVFSVFNLALYVLQNYSRWLDYIGIGLHLVYVICLSVYGFTMPFVKVDSNGIANAMLFSCFALDVLSVVADIGVYIKDVTILGIAATSLVVGLAVYIPIFRLLAKKAQKKLMYQALEDEMECELNDENKHAWFDRLKIDKFSFMCKFYLHIGLIHHSDLFIDFSLLKYSLECYVTNFDMMCYFDQILALFPSEIRLLKMFFAKTLDKPGIDFQKRFLMFQIHQIMSIRQSSASVEINDCLIQMRHLISKGINGSCSFWSDVPKSPDFLYQMRLFTEMGLAQFNEALEKWPNNVRLTEEYQSFLIEVSTDFTGGVKMKHRAELIEQGKNYVIDYSFRSLIHNFPEYLKKEILDCRGFFIVKNKLNKGSQSSGSRAGMTSISSGTIDGELDIEVEETLSKQLFSMPRLRLAFQRSFENRVSKYSLIIKFISFIGADVLIALLVFLYVFYYSRFDVMLNSMERHYLWSQVRYGIDAACTVICYNWIIGIDGYPKELLAQLMTPSNGSNHYNLNLTNDPMKEMIRWEEYSYNHMEKFLSSALDLAATGTDVRAFMYQLTNKTTRYHFCNQGVPTSMTTNQTLKVSLIYMIMKLREVAMLNKDGTPKNSAQNYRTNDNVCGIFSSIEDVAEIFDSMEKSMRDEIFNVNEEIQKESIIIGCIIICGYGLASIPYLTYLMFKYYQELKDMLKLMSGLDQQTKSQAATSFKYENSNDENTTDRLKDDKLNFGLVVIFVIGSLIFAMLLMLITILLVAKENDEFLYLNEWLYQGIQRSYYIFEAIIYSTFMITTQEQTFPKFQNKFIDRAGSMRRGWEIIDSLTFSNNALLKGSSAAPPCVNFDARIDNIHFSENCTTEPDGTYHDNYRCASLENMISLFVSLTGEILREPDMFGLIPGGTYYHMIHLANNHIIDPMFAAATYLSDNGDTSIAKFRTNLLILLVVGIAYSIFAVPIILACISKLDKAYQGGIQLLRRVPPIAFASNKALMNYLLNKKDVKNDSKMTAAKSMIHMSHDSVLCLNKNESIEVVNLAVTELFGYTPDQLLGQSISCILPEETCQEVFHQFSLMRNGQCSMIFEADVTGKSDDDTEIPVHVTILGIAENGCAKSFAVVLRDQTALRNHKLEAEAAKNKSEKLLYQILPRDIVVRLNKGETDISFSVPSATIIFIDIVRWSDYSSTLTPTQIMANLTVIFSKFDSLLSKYPLITKIKLIGDVFMAAAGLFTPEEPPQNHAAQVVNFGLDSLGMLEEANGILESNLQSRIGVNTDGPLIAGILGTDKPTFDIIGDPINVSSRLQSTCIPGTVQISKMTYDLICDMNFNIEPRGEIELKGKGKKMAYIVHAQTNGSFFIQETANA
ncbi:Adenylate and Guanylate cyclase catalytic domain containing protein [Tritrichomonas foetus]|uniref:Adenylate and Guanylate cyclase catalytic domain containing protein n=1 Tax=Tritrichomonas foetus TaxID=1144522 RepID=A0A1J4JXA4_9EUKA|nr:Adenylate and Guanylate cyclase catalytic domain containing protein [Tritrichomonas foetus]|eukprot:OHT01909.1 Adenylate and Guanylate cyclase catalytic domain containing protein [Tritrichomonas foetus]